MATTYTIQLIAIFWFWFHTIPAAIVANTFDMALEKSNKDEIELFDFDKLTVPMVTD